MAQIERFPVLGSIIGSGENSTVNARRIVGSVFAPLRWKTVLSKATIVPAGTINGSPGSSPKYPTWSLLPSGMVVWLLAGGPLFGLLASGLSVSRYLKV